MGSDRILFPRMRGIRIKINELNEESGQNPEHLEISMARPLEKWVFSEDARSMRLPAEHAPVTGEYVLMSASGALSTSKIVR